MRELIAGILEYSRLVSAEDQRSDAIESNEILGVVIQNLQATIEQTRATIHSLKRACRTMLVSSICISE